jgi:hypothetical protein
VTPRIATEAFREKEIEKVGDFVSMRNSRTLLEENCAKFFFIYSTNLSVPLTVA